MLITRTKGRMMNSARVSRVSRSVVTKFVRQFFVTWASSSPGERNSRGWLSACPGAGEGRHDEMGDVIVKNEMRFGLKPTSESEK